MTKAQLCLIESALWVDPYEPPWYIKFPALRKDKTIRTRINYIKMTHAYTHVTFPLILKIDPSLNSTQIEYPLF